MTISMDDDAQIEALETRQHWTQIHARRGGLDHKWGRLTDSSDFHILLGKQIGVFSVENDHQSSLDQDTLSSLAAAVKAAFDQLEITDKPQLHIQLEAQT